MALRRRILDFWFANPGAPDYGKARPIWFQADDAFDAEVRSRFRGDFDSAVNGGCDGMAETASGCLALVILFDQFPRNMFRGSAGAFATDDKALALAESAVSREFDQVLLPVQRLFLYLPFEHSESLADQDRSVALIQALGNEEWLDFAIRHRDVIARFGRFPHRNEILGRESTPAERAFLAQPDSSFGG